MPVLHALPSVLAADIADLHASWKSALCVACGWFLVWWPMASKPSLLVGCLSVYTLSAQRYCTGMQLLFAWQQQHCFLMTMLSPADSCVSVVQMIFHSRPIAIVLLVDMVALLMYNFSGMCVTGTTPRLSL
jgi:hypothetical protein